MLAGLGSFVRKVSLTIPGNRLGVQLTCCRRQRSIHEASVQGDDRLHTREVVGQKGSDPKGSCANPQPACADPRLSCADPRPNGADPKPCKPALVWPAYRCTGGHGFGVPNPWHPPHAPDIPFGGRRTGRVRCADHRRAPHWSAQRTLRDVRARAEGRRRRLPGIRAQIGTNGDTTREPRGVVDHRRLTLRCQSCVGLRIRAC
jgi:hypothetical protein